MARSMTNLPGGRVNRRFLILALFLGVLSAGFIYMSLSRSGGEEASDADLTVVVATRNIAQNEEITADMVELKAMPESAVPDNTLQDIEDAVGRVARTEITAKDTLSTSKIVNPQAPVSDTLRYVVLNGWRGIAITVDRVTTAGGLILPGDRVDIFWIPYAGEPAYTLFSDVEVTAVEQVVLEAVTEADDSSDGSPPASESSANHRGTDPGAEAEPQPDAATVTLLLPPEQAKKLFCANLNGDGALRLAVRAFNDVTPLVPDAPECPAPLPEDENDQAPAQQ